MFHSTSSVMFLLCFVLMCPPYMCALTRIPCPNPPTLNSWQETFVWLMKEVDRVGTIVQKLSTTNLQVERMRELVVEEACSEHVQTFDCQYLAAHPRHPITPKKLRVSKDALDQINSLTFEIVWVALIFCNSWEPRLCRCCFKHTPLNCLQYLNQQSVLFTTLKEQLNCDHVKDFAAEITVIRTRVKPCIYTYCSLWLQDVFFLNFRETWPLIFVPQIY